MSLDMYRTFAPLKQTTPTMAIACVELAGRVLGKPVTELESGKDYKQWKITRQEVMETLLDLVDLYTHHRSSTIVGQDHALEEFISIRIALNQEASAEKLARFTQSNREKAMTNGATTNGVKEKKDPKGLASPRSIASPKDIKSPQPIGLTSVTGTPVQGKPGLKEGTVRFMLDPERARDEKHTVADFFKMDEEEYEVVVENDRRRDSGRCMSSQPVEGVQTPPLLCVDIEQHQDDTIEQSWDWRHIEQENRSDQKDYPFSSEEDGKCDIQPGLTRRILKVPLPDQGLAFKAALQGSDRLSTTIRRGEYEGRAHIDKENHPAVTEYGFKIANLCSLQKRTPKMPLAEQGMAFQAALQQSGTVSPNIRGGASRHGKKNVDIRLKGAAATAVQYRAAAQRSQQETPKQQGRQH
ncbi:MAG: hypothetical protein L6R42_005126 [Xanthoria sp. 1 TBL-2021]|nr:MAG: hypothetical protein L6R42_005126 [Xanthoria sp. 1 TBL-2021]